jgi:amino acid adenylation domain-containing protein
MQAPNMTASYAQPSAAQRLIDRLKGLGVDLYLEGDTLSFRAPRGVLRPEDKAEVEALRSDVVAIIRGSERSSASIDVPLSFAQQRLWFLNRLDPVSPQYNIGRYSRVRVALDADAFKQAVTDLCQRHPAFRTKIFEENGEPRQQIMSSGAIELEMIDRPGVAPAERERVAHAAALEALRRSLDLSTGRVGLVQVISFAPDDHVSIVTTHHIVSDGKSLEIIGRDLLELYLARTEKRAVNLPPLPRTYGDFAAAEQRSAREGFGQHAAFWGEVLAGAPPLLELPADRPRPSVASTLGARRHGRIDAEIVTQLRGLARAEGATLFMALLAVWQMLLARLSGQTDVVVGTPVSTRDDIAYEDVVGCFVNNIVVRSDLSAAPNFEMLLRQTKERVLAAFRHAVYPFDLIVDTVKPQRTAAYAPIFQVMFSLLASPSAEDGQEMDETGATRFDLSVELAPLSDGGMKASYEYALDLFDAETIDRLHRQFVLLLRAACAGPAASLTSASLLTDEELSLVCEKWNDTALDYDESATVSSIIRATALAAPNMAAARCGDAELTYSALNRRVDALAALLVAKGAGPGERVAVAMTRTLDLPVALAAVLRTGAAYVPLDPGHPRDRIGLILEDANAICGVAIAETVHVLGDLDTLIVDERTWENNAPEIQRTVDPSAPAYLLYTSGSTGKPKGVLISHRNLISFLAAMRAELDFREGQRLLAVTTPSFDIAGLELWLPLTSQGCVVIAQEDDVTDGAALAELLSKHDIDLLQATPSTWRLLLEDGWDGKANLKALCGGEAMPLDLPEPLLQRVETLWNVYGPTETTIWSTTHRVTTSVVGAVRIPVGTPIANTRTYVLESGGAVAPVGAPGELLIAGDGVAIGYRNLPTLTAEKFVEIEIAGRKVRAYRTGDQARWRADGKLDFLGRRDQQVKIRGFRIELGEIEAAVISHPAVRQAYVAVSEGAGGAALVAYAVFEAGEAPTTTELRRHLRGSLPDYMVPSVFVGIESVPLSANGKVDRKRLPDPFRGAHRVNRSDEPLRPGMEQIIAEIWRGYLELDAVGPADNFYELGGHSMLSLRVAAAIERRTGWRMDPRAMFFQTLREVAAGAARTESGALS